MDIEKFIEAQKIVEAVKELNKEKSFYLKYIKNIKNKDKASLELIKKGCNERIEEINNEIIRLDNEFKDL